MRTEAVVFDRAAPVVVHHFRTVFFRADAVHPVVFVGEAAARPAEVGDFQFFQGIQHVVSIALCIGYFGFGADPKPAIDTGPEVFGELTVDMFADLLVSLLRIDTDARVFLGEEGQCGGCH